MWGDAKKLTCALLASQSGQDTIQVDSSRSSCVLFVPMHAVGCKDSNLQAGMLSIKTSVVSAKGCFL